MGSVFFCSITMIFTCITCQYVGMIHLELENEKGHIIKVKFEDLVAVEVME